MSVSALRRLTGFQGLCELVQMIGVWWVVAPLYITPRCIEAIGIVLTGLTLLDRIKETVELLAHLPRVAQAVIWKGRVAL